MLIELIWLHFVADFVLQNDKMAVNKSSSNLWLIAHSAVYMLPMLWFGWQFALINGVAHFATDWLTSRGTSKMWKMEEIHWFFTLIGFDQAIHVTTLVLTLQWLHT